MGLYYFPVSLKPNINKTPYFRLADHNPTEIILNGLSNVLLCQMIAFDMMPFPMFSPNIAYYFIEKKRYFRHIAAFVRQLGKERMSAFLLKQAFVIWPR